jgi:hypothetical protein
MTDNHMTMMAIVSGSPFPLSMTGSRKAGTADITIAIIAKRPQLKLNE